MNAPTETKEAEKLENYHRFTSRLKWSTCAKIKSMHPANGVYQRLTETLIEKFIAKMEENNATDFDPIRFDQCLQQCVIVISNASGPDATSSKFYGSSNPNSPAPAKTPDRNDRQRTTRGSRKA